MRFQEFQDSKSKEIESAIMNTLTNLRGSADDADQTSEISFNALEQILNNTGYPQFNFELFKKIYDAGSALKSIVDDFDQNTLILKTDKRAEKNPAMNLDDQGTTDVVKKMAKSALKKRT